MTATEGARTLLVTGGGSGIGAAVAERARSAGWSVVICGRRRGALDAVVERLGEGVHPVVCDVTDERAVAALVAETVERFGRLDSVVANAGVMTEGSVLDCPPEDWDRALRTNLTAPYLLARAALPALLDRGGTFVAVSSIAALRVTGGAAAYGVSKAGLVMLTQSIARDFGAQGVRANVVCPGWVRTEMADEEMAAFGASAGLDQAAAYAEVTRLVPQGRPGEAAEVADAVLWLAGDGSTYVNGACLVVDGGTVLVDPGTVAFDFAVQRRS